VLRRNFLSSLGAAALPAQPSRPSAPNIIFILADDLGYGDLGCYGQQRIQTPHLDRLAAEGLRFSQAYAGSTVCAPSRCALLTGLHTGHARMRGNTPTWLRKADLTVTELLQSAGYRTGVIGKWSQGVLGSPGYPSDKGVDEWFGYFSQMHAHVAYPQLLLHNRSEVNLANNWGTSRKQFANDLFTERAVEFVKSSGQPFFLHLAYTIPHADNEEGRDTGDGMVSPDYAPYSDRPWPKQEKGFASLVTRMDRQIGQVMQALKEKGADANTLVIFSSDNGPHQEGGHDPHFFNSNGVHRGIKRDLYDGGIRVPFIARWPGVVPAGRTSDFVTAFWDFLPTCAETAGVKAPAGLDGQSILPTLQGRTQKPHEYLYWEFHERGFHQAVRHENWKGVRYGIKQPLELYDLQSDPGEATDVAAAHPDVVRRLEGYLAQARTESPDYPIRERPAAGGRRQ
jgi:arylsulfatase A-like enzyme